MMNKRIVNTPGAPQPIGPYNQAVEAGNLLFISGQIAIDPQSGALITNNIEEETHRVMLNIKAILNEADLDFSHVVKATIFLKDLGNFSRVNAVYGSYFQESTAPARECVEVARLPRDVNVEISVIAVKP